MLHSSGKDTILTMKKPIGIAIVLGAVIIALALFFHFQIREKVQSTVDLDRPLIISVTSWPGYAAGITANGGFRENAESIFTKKYGLPVRFVLIEDMDARGKAFAKGGPNGADVMWTTIDFWANELPNYQAGGIPAKAFLQVDWSRGADAIVASESVKTIEDLRGKKIALVQFTPSHWLLESVLRQSSMTESEKEEIRNNLVFTQDVPTARAAFVAGQIDAAVLWEPDVKQAMKREGAHILTSTREFPNSIADVLVAKEEFIQEHPQAIEALIRGWLDGVQLASDNPDLAARLLMENEPMFGDLGFEETLQSLSWVHWPTLEDNARMFGFDGAPPLFDSIFTDTSSVWKRLGIIEEELNPAEAKDDSILRKVYDESRR